MVIRYFKQGPNGHWRRGVRAIELEDDCRPEMTGRLLFSDGRRGPDTAYHSNTILRNLESGDWREATAAEVLPRHADHPKTIVENVW